MMSSFSHAWKTVLLTLVAALVLLPAPKSLAQTPDPSPDLLLNLPETMATTTAPSILADITQVAVGQFHTCALTTAGSVKCWGRNRFGELGDGTTALRAMPVDVIGLTYGAAAIAASYAHTCALTTGGGVKCWGDNSSGQLGDGTRESRNTPVDVVGLEREVKSIAVGSGYELMSIMSGPAYGHTCAVTVAGGVRCWGENYFGQLGDGTAISHTTPVDVVGLTIGVTTVVAGDAHTCALTIVGGVKCWGENEFGQLGDGTQISRHTPVDVYGLTSGVVALAANTSHTCALTLGGGVKCWGWNQFGELGDGTTTTRLVPVDVSSLTSGVVAIAAGRMHTCAVTFGGGVQCWGNNGYGQLGDGADNSHSTPVNVSGAAPGIVSVTAGDSHTCAVTGAGTVQCWGADDYGQLGNGETQTYTVPRSVNSVAAEVKALADGANHTCVVTADGEAKCWGLNYVGQLGDGSTMGRVAPVTVGTLTSGVAAIDGGYLHTCALMDAGGVKCWGDNSSGQLGDGTDTDRSTPVDVVGLTSGVAVLAIGGWHSCALTVSGSVKCWGHNNSGQLGDGTTNTRKTPVVVSGLTSGVKAIAAGYDYTCALLTGGNVKCWGENSYGELGDGTTTTRLTPVDVSGLNSGVAAIAAGYDQACAAMTGGGLKCWGNNAFGDLGDGTNTDRSTPVDVVGLTDEVTVIAAGRYHTCAGTFGGRTLCWGHNYYGQLGDETTINRSLPVDVSGLTMRTRAIAAADQHTCALTDSGNVKCWGDSSGGRLGIGNFGWAPLDVLNDCYALTLQVNGAGASPQMEPARSPTCTTGYYKAGESVALTAAPAAGWRVQNWAGTLDDANSGVSNRIIILAADQEVTVNYVQSAPTSGDLYEPDNTCRAAPAIPTDGANQDHTFSAAGDEDWVRFDVMAGEDYLLIADPPADAPTDVVMEAYDDCSEAPRESQDYAFSNKVQIPFRAVTSGPAYLRLRNHDPQLGGADFRYSLSVRRLAREATIGAAIIVGGKRSNYDTLQRNINNATNSVYNLLLGHSYPHDRIQYLSSDLSLDADGDGRVDVDGLATPAAVQNAITQWAAERVDADHPLFLYLMDHGGPEQVYLNGYTSYVSSEQLARWLSQLEASRPGLRSTIVIEACNSGSFMQKPASISKANRVVITSTGAVQLAYQSEDGAIFTDYLVAALRNGATLYGSFQAAAGAAEDHHPSQVALLDDNGDGLFSATDGANAQRRGFGAADGLTGAVWAPFIAWANAGPVQGGGSTLSARVTDDKGIVSVKMVVYPPDYTPPPAGDELIREDLPTVTLTDPDGNGVYSSIYTDFSQQGAYRVVAMAEDSDGLASTPYSFEVNTGAALYLPVLMR